MHKFVRNLITEWRRLKMPVEGETVVVAVSGGADSVSLLAAMHDLQQRKKLNLRIVAAHFNHALRGSESDEDERYVRRLTTEFKIEFTTKRGHLIGDGNLEQSARIARYEFLHAAADGLDAFAVLTGHTINDQAETFLMNLIRGSGPDGLCGMKPVRPMHDEAPRPADGCEPDQEDDPSPMLFPSSPLLVRPMVAWAKRSDTEGFCHDSGVEYRYDTMNEDTAFKRVRIRKILLPLLIDMNPKIIETLANTSSLMQQVSEYQTRDIQIPITDELKLSDMSGLDQAELYPILRRWLQQHRGTMRRLELKHIQAIERLASSTKSGRTIELPGGRVVKTGGRLVYEENKVDN